MKTLGGPRNIVHVYIFLRIRCGLRQITLAFVYISKYGIIIPTTVDNCVCSVLEWTGDPKHTERSAQIQLQSDEDRCSLVMMSHAQSVLRVVDFLRHDKLLIWTSSDKQRNHLLIHVPREYDLVCHRVARGSIFWDPTRATEIVTTPDPTR